MAPSKVPLDPERQLMIKTKTAQRLIKEAAHYKVELAENQQKLQSIKADPQKDQYDIKMFQQIVDESAMMVPDSEKRLQQAILDLNEFLQTMEPTNYNNEWYETARAIVTEKPTSQEMDATETVTQTSVEHLKDGEAF